MSLVAFVGFKGSGKDTAASALVEHFGYTSLSFADSLKDCLATIFQWDRDLLSGITPDARAWREEVDVWWANKLGIPDFTPRKAMQTFGTDVMRRHFGHDIWVLNIERKLSSLKGPVVIVDGRFANELAMARRFKGKVLRIKRGPDPDWFDVAALANQADLPNGVFVFSSEENDAISAHEFGRIDDAELFSFTRERRNPLFAYHVMRMVVKVHESEWAWIGTDVDATIENDGTIAMLQDKVARLCIL